MVESHPMLAAIAEPLLAARATLRGQSRCLRSFCVAMNSSHSSLWLAALASDMALAEAGDDGVVGHAVADDEAIARVTLTPAPLNQAGLRRTRRGSIFDNPVSCGPFPVRLDQHQTPRL